MKKYKRIVTRHSDLDKKKQTMKSEADSILWTMCEVFLDPNHMVWSKTQEAKKRYNWLYKKTGLTRTPWVDDYLELFRKKVDLYASGLKTLTFHGDFKYLGFQNEGVEVTK